MRISLLGYGKMGKAIEAIAIERGHSIVFKIDLANVSDRSLINTSNTDVVIEFSSPHSALDNLEYCMKSGLKVICGTTGWINSKQMIEQLCLENKAAFFYASNYSIGVNLFFKLNSLLATLMNGNNEYTISTTEIHHTEKLDAPSGTAITLAEGIINANDAKNTWVNNEIPKPNEVSIWSSREGKVPGTHGIKYISNVDEIEIKHTAYTRTGFALGAIIAAEWLKDKSGIYSMNDMLKLG